MEKESTQRLDLEQIRERLSGATGKRYWRGLEEIAETPEFQEWMDDEFPNRRTISQIDRRQFLKLMGASMALAGLSGCRHMFMEQDRLVPYVTAPEEVVPGKPLFFASALTLGGYATGVLVESHVGRPIKIEGNPNHPASLGATDARTQAEILNLYDPDRLQSVTHRGDISSWSLFNDALVQELTNQRGRQGAGLRILTETVTSPTLAAQIAALLQQYPQARWHQYEPCARDSVMRGAQLAFGTFVNTVYDFRQAQVVVSLDADFLGGMPGSVRYARDFMDGRRLSEGSTQMNRLYVIESTPSITGATADHRWPVRATDIEAVARTIAGQLGVGGANPGTGETAGLPAAHLQALIRDLQAHAGTSIVVAGEGSSAEVHALVHAINGALGNVGRTLRHTDPIEARPVLQAASIRELVQEMQEGQVEALVILGSNAVYSAPADVPFAEALQRVRFVAYHGLHNDETARRCEWVLPATHALEQWGDARSFEGSVTIQQPLTAPLYQEARSAYELLGFLVQEPIAGYDILRRSWQERLGGDFEGGWRRALHDGVIEGSALPTRNVSAAGLSLPPMQRSGTESIELIFRPHPSVYDGRFANNGWLQELPTPLSLLTWDNAAMVSPAMAERLNLRDGEVVELVHGTRSVTAPAFIFPGHPDRSITVHLGYGREEVGLVAEGTGFNAYRLRTSEAMDLAQDVQVRRTGARWPGGLATTQVHHSLDGRDIVRAGLLSDYLQDPSLRPEDLHELDTSLTLYPDQIFNYGGPQWGMTIDLNTCIGCNACVVACQAENNIPVVGKDQVKNARELHWLRIDRYYGPRAGRPNLDNPETFFQPLMCVHCEKAPCEPVCPVAATVHSMEGLNQMIYNRCVGTRYCSNNCPYKVRRFNYFNYSDNQVQFRDQAGRRGTSLLKMANNPDVTVRGRGVMEKCTYCVQRINHARIEAKKAGREIADGEIVTACQQACPTQTIVFGNVADPESRVSRLRREQRAYRLLEEINTRPRTSHLGKIRNPNPEIQA
jgi:MoCo/4Fe-4S cofactor protein with predicted Tat translocation signal